MKRSDNKFRAFREMTLEEMETLRNISNFFLCEMDKTHPELVKDFNALCEKLFATFMELERQQEEETQRRMERMKKELYYHFLFSTTNN